MYKGDESPLDMSARHVHGSDGLGGCDSPDASFAAREATVIEFLGGVRSSGYTLACLGPLTNAAALLQTDAAASIERFVPMGGGFGTQSFEATAGVVPSRGNVVPEAEFNIHADPALDRHWAYSRQRWGHHSGPLQDPADLSPL